MINFTIKLYIVLALTACFVTSEAAARSGLEKKIDSLFVIASSGELRYSDLTEPAMDSIAALGAPAVPWLVEKLSTKSARERLTVIWILQRIGGEAVPYLVSSLNRSEELIVGRICWALGDIKDSTSVQPLINVSGHSDWSVRDQAVEALGKIGDTRANEIVMQSLADTLGQVRKAAVVSCGQLAINEAIPDLINCFADDFYGARLEAVNSLLKLDTQKVISFVADSINSQRIMVGNLCCDVLREIKTDHAIEILSYQAFNSPIAGTRAHAAAAIINADPEDLCGWHNKLLENNSDRFTLLKIQSALKTIKKSDE